MATKSRITKRIRNPGATRAKLLQATIDLVTEKGSDALSLKEAARRAKVSRGVAYLHFDDRDQLLNEAKSWIAERLQEGVQRFQPGATFHDRTVYTTKLVLEHPEAAKLMISAALAGRDLDRQHPLYKLIVKMFKELKASGKVRADMDLEVMTYIMFGSTAATIMLGAQHPNSDTNELAERFTNEWGRILREGIFVKGSQSKAKSSGREQKPRKQSRARSSAK